MSVEVQIGVWVAVLGSLCAVACAVPGTLLVLRRQSMMGDAISHTVLPGLAIAFLITHSRDPLPMFIGAVLIGLLTALAVQWVQRLGRMDSGTSMGVVFTTLFALGIVLMSGDLLRSVDLDAKCVLYGNVDAAASSIILKQVAVPRELWTLGGVLAMNALLVGVFYKEFKVSAFDPALADSLGISSRAMHYLLMTMTAITTVAAFEVVGSIIVIAMLIVPAATAYLLTDRFGWMFVWSVVFGVLAVIGGTVAAVTVPTWFGYTATVSAGAMAVAGGLLFVGVWFASPRHGLASKYVHRAAMSLRVLREDVLGLLYRLEEMRVVDHAEGTPRFLRRVLDAGPIASRLALRALERRGLICATAGVYALTDAGRDRARRLVRTHRLWESYLAHHMHIPVDHVHGSAEVLEHVTTDEMQDRLADETAQPMYDPHGKRVPPAGRE